jgi:nucleolar complex protein 2
MLKRWLKQASNKNTGNKNGKVNTALALLVQKLEANAKWIEDHRAKVDFAPNKREGVDGFLKGFDWQKTPLGAFVAGQRKQREEAARLLEAAKRDDDRRQREREENARAESGEAEAAAMDTATGTDTDNE